MVDELDFLHSLYSIIYMTKEILTTLLERAEEPRWKFDNGNHPAPYIKLCSAT